MDFQDERSRQLATKPVGKLLLQYTTPCIIAMAASSIYNLCDSIFIGQGAGPLAIAGLAITFPLMNISSAFGAMAGVGAAAQTSIRMGMKDQATALQVFGNMIRLDLTIGLVLTTIGLVFIDPILTLFGASEATLPYARDYMQIILIGNVITHTFLGMNDQLRATGHPRTAMTAQLIAVVMNIILDALFIFGLGMGMRGAALATILGQVCGWIFEFRYFLKKDNFVYFSKLGLRFRMDIIRKILSIGLSPFCVNLCMCIVVIFLNRALLEQGGAEGDQYVGVYGICNRLALLMIMCVMGFGQGLQPIVGFNMGAGLLNRVRGVMKVALACATAIMTVGYCLVWLFTPQLASLFTTDPDLIDKCVPALRIIMCAFPLVGGQMLTMSFFQSVGRAKIAIFLSVSRQMLFLLPMLIILPELWGVYGVWWSLPLSDLISCVIANIMLVREMRRMKRLVREIQDSKETEDELGDKNVVCR